MKANSEKAEPQLQTAPTDPFITYGTAKKASWDMTFEEQAAVAEELDVRVRQTAFAHNLPVYFESDGYVCAEYADGAIIKLKPI